MELLDVSVPIREGMVIYPGDPPVRLERVADLAGGALANVSRLELGVHTGTHVDAPLHFLEGGSAAETLPLDVLVGRAEVVDARPVAGLLSRTALESLGLPYAERILFRTTNSELWERDAFSAESVELDGGGAAYLVERGVRLVGIDYLSVGDAEAHRVLLGAGVVVVESLDLRAADPGSYRLLCLPLRLVGADGAPARAVLLRE